MPKVKTHSGAKKRFKITPKGKVRGRHAMRSHILGKKNAKRRRRLDEPKILADPDKARVKALLRK
jgi:large subunit ribosomal protein L35